MDQAARLISRRNILIGVTGAAVAGIVATSRLAQPVEQGARRLLASNRFTRRFLSLADAEQAEWSAQAGSVFTVEGGYRLRLAGTRPLQSGGARPPGTRERAFLAVFDVLDGATLPADLIYSVRHPQYGRLPLFLSASDSAARMFAVFN
jgi:hypothetical protein